MKLAITTFYTMSTDTVFDMPEGKTWDDVEEWHVKWDKLYLYFKDKLEMEVDINIATMSDVDFKHPDRTSVRPIDANGYPDWNEDALEEA